MSDVLDVELKINGEEVKARVPSDLSLMRFLREWLGLTGTKDGCSSGHCGSCTVILNGKATRSCLIKMSRANGSTVETIEGLAANGKLHPLQYSFIVCGAVQCGFCTPGMIMSAKALLDTNTRPTRDEIITTLTTNRNLCRCTGYVQIIEAIKMAGEMLEKGQYPEIPPAEGDAVSSTLLIRESLHLVTGQTKFSDDLVEKDMLYGKILWAEHPHAEIVKIDTAEAEAVEGVVRIVTAKDVPGKNQAGIITRDQPAIAFDKTRYIGDSLAAVFADTPETAAKAVKKIKVEYKILPGVFSPEKAAEPGAPKVHEKGNLFHHARIIRGDVDEAFEKCSVISENNYSTPFIEHGFIEPESGLGIPAEDGGVIVKLGTQTVFDDRTQLCEILDMPEEKVRVIQMPMGGAFGGKEDIILQQYLALGALLTKKTVKITLTRSESLRVHVKRTPVQIYYKTGADASGKVLALEARVLADCGAYASLTKSVLEHMVIFGAGPYYIPNLAIDAKAYYTNNVPAGAMRGMGVNQMSVGLEQNMDEMARALKMDPFDFRLTNALDVGLPTAADHILKEGVVSIKEVLQAAQKEYKKLEIPSPEEGKLIGVGVAAAVKNVGFGKGAVENAGVTLKLNADGSVLLEHSQHEYGQGAGSALAQFASTVLGTPVKNIELIGPDTAITPPTGPTTASRQTFLTGNAVVRAAEKLKGEVIERASRLLKVDTDRLELNLDRVIDKETGEYVLLEKLGEQFVVKEQYNAPRTTPLLEVGKRSNYGTPEFESRPTQWCYCYNTQVAVVEVDQNTGQVKVLKVICVNDLGKVINRHAVLGQIYGGVMMGIGFALSEEFLVKDGINTTDTLRKVGLPTADYTPEVIPVLLEVPHPEGPFGVKGFAEAPSLAIAPAVLNGIYDATGIRIYDIPAKKEKVLAAMSKKKD